jgi:cytolysin-activating lysine-acyltransferase
MTTPETLGQLAQLMRQSDRHREYTIDDLFRCTWPPIALDQAALVYEGFRLVGYGSFAQFSDEAEQAFVSGERKLQFRDWCSGPNLWILDVIAPLGHYRQVVTKLKAKAIEHGLSGEVKFRRTKILPAGMVRRYSRIKL